MYDFKIMNNFDDFSRSLSHIIVQEKKLKNNVSIINEFLNEEKLVLNKYFLSFDKSDLDELINKFKYKDDDKKVLKGLIQRALGEHYEKCAKQLFPDYIWDYSQEKYTAYIMLLKRYSQFLKNENFSTSQIRNIFGEIKKIKENSPHESKILLMQKLRPRLAYTIGRFPKNKGIKSFFSLLENLISQLDTKKTVLSLYEFIEAVLCYLKYYGDNN